MRRRGLRRAPRSCPLAERPPNAASVQNRDHRERSWAGGPRASHENHLWAARASACTPHGAGPVRRCIIRPVTRILKWLGVSLALLILITLSMPFFIDVDQFRPALQTDLSNALGRAVT